MGNMAAKKRVLVLGVRGMLGYMVRRVLAESGTIDVLGTHRCDRDDPYHFDAESGLGNLAALCDCSPGYDYFVNCIGILPGKITERDPNTIRKAIRINSLFPHELSGFAKERGIRTIHISTDGVFSGEAEAYCEDDAPDGSDLYGITKSLGEVCEKHFLNLRCSIVGPSPYVGGGLMEWFLRQPAGAVVTGYTNHVWHGVSTYQYGSLCLTIIEGGHFDKLRSESAVFHFAPNEPVTKHRLLCLFNQVFGKQVIVEAKPSDAKMHRRVLQTKYRGVRNIYPHGIPAASMVSELARYMGMTEPRETHGRVHR
jgi:dTDP-4-dehydrorhamnose reductase